MAATARYHINAEGQVKRCSAASETSCPFGAEAHFTGTKDQAEFMQESLNAAAGKAETGVVNADYIHLPFRGDNLRAEKESDGKYTVKLNSGRVLAEHVELPGGNDAAGLKRWAVQDSPYMANKIEVDAEREPGVKELRAVFVKNADGSIENHGFIYKAEGNTGWSPLLNLDELKTQPHAPNFGYFGAISRAHSMSKDRHQQSQAQMDEYNARAFYDMSKGEQLYEDDAHRVLHRSQQWADRVYKVDSDTTDLVRARFRAIPDSQLSDQATKLVGAMPDDEDQVYIHEVRDSRNDARVDQINVIWGARSWSTRARSFFSGGGVSAEAGLVEWLRS